ncbi:hypothetical protein BGX29_005342, partial [Mortierella sp. GBA35]
GSTIATVDRGGLLQLWDLVSDSYSEVYQTMIGPTACILWKRSPGDMVLATITMTSSLCYWILEENQGAYNLKLAWSIGTDALYLYQATLDDIDELSPVNLALMKQRVTLEYLEYLEYLEDEEEEQ